jgi:hypothetical protein
MATVAFNDLEAKYPDADEVDALGTGIASESE